MRPIILIGSLLIAIATAVVYSQVFPGAFIGPDNSEIRADPRMNSWVGLPEILYEGNMLPARPVGNLSFIVNRALTGSQAKGYLLINLVLHICNAWLVCRLFSVLLKSTCQITTRQSDWLAVGFALLWAVHPLNTQAVASAYQRHELWMTLFFVAALIQVVHFAATGGVPRLVFAALLGLLAGLSKETAAILPVVALLVTWCVADQVAKRSKTRVRLAAVLATLTAPAAVGALFAVQKNIYMATLLASDTPPLQYLATQMQVIVRYLSLAFYPVHQSYSYDWPLVETMSEILPSLGIIAVFLASGLALLYNSRLTGFGILLCFVALAPTSTLVPLEPVAAEYRMYLPLIGLLVAIMGFFAILAPREQGQENAAELDSKEVGVAPVLGVVLCLGAVVAVLPLSFRRASIYQTPKSIWQATSEAGFAPLTSKLELASMALNEGDFAVAETLSLEVAEADPGNVTAWTTLASSLSSRGASDRATELLEKALETVEDDGRISLALGNASVESDPVAAQRHFEKAVELAPAMSEAWNNLGIILARDEQNYERAEKCYQTALQHRFDNKQAFFNLAALQLKSGRPYEARATLLAAQRVLGNDADVVQRIQTLDKVIEAAAASLQK